MKKIIFILVSVLTANFINAQYYKVLYEQTRNATDQLEQIEKIPDPKLREQIKAQLLAPSYFNLLIDGNISLYKKTDYVSGNEEAPEESRIENVKVVVAKSESTGIYKNYKTGEYLSGQSIVGRDFYIKDKVVKYDWKLTNETKKIGNFNAKKATATYDGKQVEAWYAEEIPINAGPGAYNGLPGLIVQVNSGESVFNAISVEKLSQKPTIEKPVQKEKSRVVTRDEFAKQIERIRQQ